MLIADPMPAFPTGIEPIKAVVNGATTSVIPIPKSRIAGRTSMSAELGGTQVEASLGFATHASLVAGIRASQSWPMAISAGPTTRNGQTPTRPATVPTRVEATARMSPDGRDPMTAAASAVYPRTP